MSKPLVAFSATFPAQSGYAFANLVVNAYVSGSNIPAKLFSASGVLMGRSTVADASGTVFGYVEQGTNLRLSLSAPGVPGVLSTQEVTAGGVPVVRAGVGTPTIPVAASRNFLPSDEGQVLECTATVSLTFVQNTLPSPFQCTVITNGTTSFVSDGTVTINGATTTVTRAASAAPNVRVVSKTSVANAYTVSV